MCGVFFVNGVSLSFFVLVSQRVWINIDVVRLLHHDYMPLSLALATDSSMPKHRKERQKRKLRRKKYLLS